MDDKLLEIVRESLNIDNALDVIGNYENNQELSQENPVKWKSYFNQVVVETEKFFYKIYEGDEADFGPFNSLIREKLANVYSEMGIDWRVVTFIRDGNRYDFEQREKLKVATPADGSFAEILLSFSQVYDKVEESLEFNSILNQLKEFERFRDVCQLKLTRQCVNKYEDYAIFNGQAVLLDDAEFYIAMVDKCGSPVVIDEALSIPIETSYGKFLFTNCNKGEFIDDEQTFNLPSHYSATHGWFLFKEQEAFASKGEIVRALEENKKVLMNTQVSSVSDAIEVAERCGDEGWAQKTTQQGIEETMRLREKSEDELTEDDYLYHNNLGRMTFQWELWHCCNNLCKFCYLGKENRHTNKERQLLSLHDLMDSLDNFDSETYNNVSLIGGEFFQGQIDDPEVHEAFFQMIDKLCDLYVNKKIGSIWITATLTLGDQADMYKMLDTFERRGVLPNPNYGASGVWICTSWDAEGRFHTEKHRRNWENHMKTMSAYYPWVKKNTTVILTQKLCEEYLADKFRPRDFMQSYKTCLFYKQPGFYEEVTDDEDGFQGNAVEMLEMEKIGKIDEFLMDIKRRVEKQVGFRFFPDRKTFRKFLVKYAKEDADTFERLFNIKFRADELHRNFNDNEQVDAMTRDKNSNLESTSAAESIVNMHCRIEPKSKKHIVNYATYCDCNECMICDRNQIWESVHGGKY